MTRHTFHLSSNSICSAAVLHTIFDKGIYFEEQVIAVPEVEALLFSSFNRVSANC